MIIPHIDLSVTTKCSLRCKNCTQWNPYIKDPETFPSQSIIKNFEKLLSNVDFVLSVAVIGGEALLNHHVAEVIEFLASNKKIGRILFITNGTIIPDESVINSLKHSNILVWIDKYGNHSIKADELNIILKTNGVNVSFEHVRSWWDFGLMTRKDMFK